MDASTVVALLKFCLTSTSSQYKENHYNQRDDVAMRSPVLPVIADIFMEDFEDQVHNGGGEGWNIALHGCSVYT